LLFFLPKNIHYSCATQRCIDMNNVYFFPRKTGVDKCVDTHAQCVDTHAQSHILMIWWAHVTCGCFKWCNLHQYYLHGFLPQKHFSALLHCISQTCVHAHAHTPSTVYDTHECTVYHKHVYTHTHEDIWYLVLVCNVFRIWCNVIYSAARVTNMCTRTRTHTKTFDILYSYDMSMFMFSMCIASDIWYLVLVW